METPQTAPVAGRIINFAVIVAALGYFVDLYDLVLFGVVKDASLRDIGIAAEDMMRVGENLLSTQMIGMLVGGILWGVLGDRLGRLRVLFGSILLYSLANLANGMISDLNSYYILRFIAGVGLAGELGAGVTLISETLPTRYRGLGTMLIVVFGALGAVLAALVGGKSDWRTAYYIGGGLGLLLLFMRVGTYESGMFHRVKESDVSRGAILSLFTSRSRLIKYINCIIIGIPVWYAIGTLIFNGKEFAAELGVQGDIIRGQCIMYGYLGLSAGDLISGLLSQALRSRKKTVVIFLLTCALSCGLFLFATGVSPQMFYFLCFLIGAATGYWAIFVIIAAEQFGTNIRSTVTTTVPNFVRGAVYPLTFIFASLRGQFGLVNSAIILGAACILLALLAILNTRESFDKELDYMEELS